MPHWYGTHKSFGSPLRSPRRIGVQSHNKKKKKNGAAAAGSPNSSTSRLSAVPDLSANSSPTTTTYYQGTSGITVQSGVTTISRTNDAERNLYKQVKKALQKQASLEDLQALVLQNPSVVELMNDDGWFLLHYACYYYSSASFQVIEFLVKLFPAAVSRAADETQVTPLHLACFRAASLNIIQLIVQYDKTGVRRVNAEGWTPLYFAVLSNAELAVIEYLVQLYPIACLLIVDKTRGTYPLLVLEKEKAKRRQQKQHDDNNPRRHQDILDFIARCTVDGTLGLLEAAASNASSSKALAVKVHILKMQKQYDIPLDDNVLRQWLLQHTTALHHLLNDDNMQGMLLENNKTVQEHVWRRQQQKMTSQNSNKLLTTLSPLPKSSSSRKIKIKDRHASSVVLGGDDDLLSPPFSSSKSKETSSPPNKKSPARNTLSAPCLLKQSPPPSRRERKGGVGGGGTSTMPASTAKKNSSSSVPDIPLLQSDDDDDKEGRRNLSAPNLLQKKRSPPPSSLKPLPFPVDDLSSLLLE